MPRLLAPVIACLALLVLPACQSANRLLKARPVKLSPFFEQPKLAVDARKHLPFHTIWTTPDAAVMRDGLAAKKIYIAPVELKYLRPVDGTMARKEIDWGVQRQLPQVAWHLREEFAGAFRRSGQPRYQLVRSPGRDVLTLRLAIIELNPTSPKGNAVLTLARVMNPLAGFARYFTMGNMAIEGKVTTPGGRVFFQFADKESDKLTLISARDYQPYGHAAHAMREWAEQFEKMTRSPAGMRVPDSSAISLSLR